MLAYSGVVAPVRGRTWFATALQDLRAQRTTRRAVYRRMLGRQLVRLAVVLVAVVLVPLGAAAVPVVTAHVPHGPHDLARQFVNLSTAVEVGTLLLIQLVIIGRGARIPGFRKLAPLLPRTAAERREWTLVSIGAGVSEELLYRGVLPALMLILDPRLSLVDVMLLQAVLFGVAHYYQGLVGMVATAVVGALLGLSVLATGSLWPAVVAHVVLDARFVLLPPSALAWTEDAVPLS